MCRHRIALSAYETHLIGALVKVARLVNVAQIAEISRMIPQDNHGTGGKTWSRKSNYSNCLSLT